MPTAFREAGLAIQTYFERYEDPALPDAVWLADVSRHGLITVSHDRQIYYDPLAKRAVMENGGRVIFLRGQCAHDELAAIFVRSVARIEKFIEHQQEPFIAAVRRAATHADPLRTEVRMILTYAEWIAGGSWAPATRRGKQRSAQTERRR